MVTAQDVTWVTELPSYQAEAVNGKIIPWKRFSIALDYDSDEDEERLDTSVIVKQFWKQLSQLNTNGIFSISSDKHIADIYYVQWNNHYYFLTYEASERDLLVITDKNLLFAIAMDWLVMADDNIQKFVYELINEAWRYSTKPTGIVDYCDEYDFRPLVGKRIWKNK